MRDGKRIRAGWWICRGSQSGLAEEAAFMQLSTDSLSCVG